MHRVTAEFVVLRLEMFSWPVVRHRRSESRLMARNAHNAIRVTLFNFVPLISLALLTEVNTD